MAICAKHGTPDDEHDPDSECFGGNEPKPEFYFDGLNYVFQRQEDGGSRMVCEVRGVGDGKFEENSKLLVDSLNDRKGLIAGNAVLSALLKSVSDWWLIHGEETGRCGFCEWVSNAEPENQTAHDEECPGHLLHKFYSAFAD